MIPAASNMIVISRSRHARGLAPHSEHAQPTQPRSAGGKVEHLQQTIEKWLEARPKADSLAELGSATSATVDAEKIWRIGSSVPRLLT
jgi:hypothetical protein